MLSVLLFRPLTAQCVLWSEVCKINENLRNLHSQVRYISISKLRHFRNSSKYCWILIRSMLQGNLHRIKWFLPFFINFLLMIFYLNIFCFVLPVLPRICWGWSWEAGRGWTASQGRSTHTAYGSTEQTHKDYLIDLFTYWLIAEDEQGHQAGQHIQHTGLQNKHTWINWLIYWLIDWLQRMNRVTRQVNTYSIRAYRTNTHGLIDWFIDWLIDCLQRMNRVTRQVNTCSIQVYNQVSYGILHPLCSPR